ncbi:MAG: HlyD family efflux transporter periplasmic adaptor subunit [Clostridia bacterium]|nr:HlyD family efflux transporter periplasmic adaptor subunit [Clostridia bacterium]
MNKLVRIAACLTALCLIGATACAEMIFEGSVVCPEAVPVVSPFGAMVDSLSVSAGERIEKGAHVASMDTVKVYAPCEGTVAGVFGTEGDSIEGITERYGAVMYIEPLRKYTITASTEKAYNLSENKFIHIGEEVWLCCTADGTHQGRGIVTGFGEDVSKYTVEVFAGEFSMGETVGIFRSADYASRSRIGRGTVSATAPVAVKGSGSIIKLHVKSGDYVEKGELLFETVSGNLDGMYSPGSDIIAGESGIVATVAAAPGTSVEKHGAVITIYPDSALEVQVPVAESELSMIAVGDSVKIEFTWDLDGETVFDGVVTGISYINSAESGEPVYTASIAFTPDDTVRMGMTVLVYAQ